MGIFDNSIFRSLGGIWHTKHMKEDVVPHPSIDTQASCGKSDYHGWRFGYGLHLMANEFRFPVATTVSTASDKDYNFVEKLLIYLYNVVGIIVGDRGYFCPEVIEKIKIKTIFSYKPLKFLNNPVNTP